jgi:hypothetical protein
VVFTPGDAGFQSYDPNWKAVRSRVQKALKETASGVDDSTKKSKAKSEDLEDICGYHPEKP